MTRYKCSIYYDDFLIAHYATDEDRVNLAELDAMYGTAEKEYCDMGTNPDATDADVSHARENLLSISEQWYTLTDDIGKRALKAYENACDEYAKQDSKRTKTALIHKDITDIISKLTVGDFCEYIRFYSDAHTIDKRDAMIEQCLYGIVNPSAPLIKGKITLKTVESYLYDMVTAQQFMLSALQNKYGTDTRCREISQRAREILADYAKITAKSLVPPPKSIVMQTNLLHKTLFNAMTAKSEDDAISVRVRDGISDVIMPFIDKKANVLYKSMPFYQIDRFICDFVDTGIEESEDGIFEWTVTSVCLAMIDRVYKQELEDGEYDTDAGAYNVSDGLIEFVNNRIAFLTMARCMMDIQNSQEMYDIEQDKHATYPLILNATPSLRVDKRGNITSTYISETHSPFYELSAKAKQLSVKKKGELCIISAPITRKNSGKRKVQTATARTIELKLFIYYKIVDMRAPNNTVRKIEYNTIYKHMLRFDGKTEYGKTERARIRDVVDEILFSFKAHDVIKDYKSIQGTNSEKVGIDIKMPQDKPKKS